MARAAVSRGAAGMTGEARAVVETGVGSAAAVRVAVATAVVVRAGAAGYCVSTTACL